MSRSPSDSPAPPHEEEVPDSACPSFAAAMDVIGRRWTGIIVQAVGEGSSSFTEISRFVGRIGDTMLAKRLRELEADGLIVRTVTDGRPVGVLYSLTARGVGLLPILGQITDWGHVHTMATTTSTL